MFKKSKVLLKWLLSLPLEGCLFWINTIKIFFPSYAFKLIDRLIELSDQQILDVKHTHKNKILLLKFNAPNSLCRYRVSTFASKEPETLRWIEEFGGDGAFYDIGANIGLYSVYYAKLFKNKVYSFEPSVFNVKQLCKNISLNLLSDQIIYFPLPLTSEDQISKFKINNFVEGGALNSFGVNYGYDGKPFKSKVMYSLPGLSLDSMIEKEILKETPSIIKIDVDGIEHLILQGAKKLISSKKCKSILIEVNENFNQQRNQINYSLKKAGFKLLENFFEKEQNYKSSFAHVKNQIWIK